MKKADYVHTPRFLSVKIQKVFRSHKTAHKYGFTEPTYYENDEYDVLGKHIDTNRMIFAGVQKVDNK